MNTKIDFMAGLPPAQKKQVSSLGLEVGQTWRTRTGILVTVAEEIERFDGKTLYLMRREDTPAPSSYRVHGSGFSVDHGTERFDLAERVERVYIAGPMTGYADLNFPAFNAAAAEYRRRGCFVINPAEINGGPEEAAAVALMTTEQYQTHWIKCMRRDVAELVTCDTIVLLDGWTKSRGATLEHHVARELGFTICYPVDTFKDQ